MLKMLLMLRCIVWWTQWECLILFSLEMNTFFFFVNDNLNFIILNILYIYVFWYEKFLLKFGCSRGPEKASSRGAWHLWWWVMVSGRSKCAFLHDRQLERWLERRRVRAAGPRMYGWNVDRISWRFEVENILFDMMSKPWWTRMLAGVVSADIS